MEVRSGAGAGISYVGNYIAPLYPLSGLDIEPGIVREARPYAVSMAYLHQVAVPRPEARLGHHPVGRRHHRRAGLGRDIHALMELQNAAERRGPVAKGRRNPSPDGPHRRSGSVERTFVFKIFNEQLEACLLLERRAFKLRQLLDAEARSVLCSDPYVKLESLVSEETLLEKSDIIIIAAPHACYRSVRFPEKPVFDIWNLRGLGRTL